MTCLSKQPNITVVLLSARSVSLTDSRSGTGKHSGLTNSTTTTSSCKNWRLYELCWWFVLGAWLIMDACKWPNAHDMWAVSFQEPMNQSGYCKPAPLLFLTSEWVRTGAWAEKKLPSSRNLFKGKSLIYFCKVHLKMYLIGLLRIRDELFTHA